MGRTKKNIIYQMAYQILAIILPLITTPIVTRALGADGLGQYSYTYAIVSYFCIFSLLGVNTYGTREISRANVSGNRLKLSEVFCGIYYLQLFLSIVVILIYYIFVFVFVDKYKVLLLLQGIVILGTMIDISWLYFGLEKFKITVTKNLFVKLFCAVAIIFFVKDPNDIYLYTTTLALSSFLSNFALFVSTRKYINFCRVPISGILSHLKPNLMLFIPIIAASIFNYTDKIMLGSLTGTVQTGYYEAMEKIINVPMACVSGVANVLFPRISALTTTKTIENEKQIKKYIHVSLLGVLWFSIACIFGMKAVAGDFVPLFLGNDFLNAILVIQLGCIILLPKSFRILLNSECLLPYGKDKVTIFSTIVAALCNVAFNFIMIPKLGAIGAEFATICSEIIYCLIMIISIRKQFSVKRIIASSIPFFLFGYCMMKVIYVLQRKIAFNIVINLCVEITVGGIVYIILSCIYLFLYYRFFKKGDQLWCASSVQSI